MIHDRDTPLRVVITGGSGYLGSALLRYISRTRPQWETHATYFKQAPKQPVSSWHPLDLRAGDSVTRILRALEPELIIHTAAKSQGASADLHLVNARGTEFVARAAHDLGARMIHLSTDVVFDGRKGNYCEDDAPNPIHAYGASKLAAERAVMDSGVRAAIVRTSLIYGFAPLDPRTRAMLDGHMPRLFTDESRCPIWVENLCEALVELADSECVGVLHVAGSQPLSRYEFGLRLMHLLGGDTNHLIPTSAVESPLVRPLDCTLDISRARGILKTKLLGVDQVLHQIFIANV